MKLHWRSEPTQVACVVCGGERRWLERIERERDAERYPTEEELCHAVTKFPSWHQVVQNLKADKDTEVRGAVRA